MAIRLGSTVINCADLELMTSFWSQAVHLARSPADDDDEFRVLPSRMAMSGPNAT